MSRLPRLPQPLRVIRMALGWTSGCLMLRLLSLHPPLLSLSLRLLSLHPPLRPLLPLRPPATPTAPVLSLGLEIKASTTARPSGFPTSRLLRLQGRAISTAPAWGLGCLI